jgi:acetyltransferase
MTDATAVAKGLQKFKGLPGKPILASWMGGDDVAEGEAILNASVIPTFQYPDEAARSFCYMWRYSDNLRALYETPALGADKFDIGLQPVTKRGDDSCRPKSQLTEPESKEMLEAYGIPTVKTLIAAWKRASAG